MRRIYIWTAAPLIYPWQPHCSIIFSADTPGGEIIPRHGDNLTGRPPAFLPSPHYERGFGISAPHMLEQWMLSQYHHFTLYLQSLHVRLHWGRCPAGCPPDLCVQPEKVRLRGTQVWTSLSQTRARCRGREGDEIQTDTMTEGELQGWGTTPPAVLYLLS